MANRNKHIQFGAVVGGACNLAWQLDNIMSADKSMSLGQALSRVNYWEVAGFAALGGVIFACLPDLLEPATSPVHRRFFHSYGCGTAVVYGAFGKHSEEWTSEDRMKVQSMALSYLSHLFLDSSTPAGLPLL